MDYTSLGPIDPQVRGIPAYNVVAEFLEAKKELAEHPENAKYWQIQLNKYPAAFLKLAYDAIDLSGILVREWLETCMFCDASEKDKIDGIVKALNEHDNSKEHGRHFNIDFCKELGLKIIDMEEDQKLQDAVLSVHHVYMITMNGTATAKIIESQNNKTWIMNGE